MIQKPRFSSMTLSRSQLPLLLLLASQAPGGTAYQVLHDVRIRPSIAGRQPSVPWTTRSPLAKRPPGQHTTRRRNQIFMDATSSSTPASGGSTSNNGNNSNSNRISSSSLSQSSTAVSFEGAATASRPGAPRRSLRELLQSPLSEARSWWRDLTPAAAKDNAKVPSYRSLAVFLSTTVLIWLSEPLLSLVDTTVVGYSQGASGVLQLAALGPATTLMDTLLYMTYFLAIGTTNFLSQGLAESRWRDLQKTTSHMLGVALTMGLGVLSLVWLSGSGLLTAMAGESASAQLVQYAVKYARIRSLVAPAAVMGMVAQSFCLVNLNTRAPAVAVLVASIVNIVGDLTWAKHGVVGAATATALASTAASAWLMRAVWRQVKEWRKLEVEEWRQEQERAREQERLQALEQQQPVLELVPPSHRFTGLNDTTTFASSATMDVPSDTAATVPTETDVEPLHTQVASSQNKVETTSAVMDSPPPKVPFLSLPDFKSLIELARISGPLCVNMWAKYGAYSALTMAATSFGVVPLAAHNIIMRIFFFFACFGDAMGMCAQSFLPPSLYPKRDSLSFRTTQRRLITVAVAMAAVVGQTSLQLVQGPAGTVLARDAGMLRVFRSQAPWLALSLFIHPLITVQEGTVIATRKFGSLIKTYAVSCLLHVGLISSAGSLTSVWKAMVVFQLARMVNYKFWSSRSNTATVTA